MLLIISFWTQLHHIHCTHSEALNWEKAFVGLKIIGMNLGVMHIVKGKKGEGILTYPNVVMVAGPFDDFSDLHSPRTLGGALGHVRLW
jgi:hypothetical protein